MLKKTEKPAIPPESITERLPKILKNERKTIIKQPIAKFII